MLIIGAKGFAKEILQSLDNKLLEPLAFYDDVNKDIPEKLYGCYPVLKKEADVLNYFHNVSDKFCLGLGNPQLRLKLFKKFDELGGTLVSTIDKATNIGKYAKIGGGTNILSGVNISNGAELGKGCLVYYNVVITHDVKIGEFVELSPACKLLGHVNIGNYVSVGAGAIILPKVQIDEGAVIGAGAIVTKDVAANSVVVGNPAKPLKQRKGGK
ncbi:acetyltransferase [uncultured Mesonia sp.]|uniref:acetyltransferase n=1 Tax=uncultured Mesonia sp. TaxID=399731 RepID=UPI00374EDCCD